MIRELAFSVAVVSLFASASPARATDEFVKKEVSGIVADFNDSRLAGKMFSSIEKLLASVTEKLQKEGHSALAQQIASEWVQVASLNASQFGTLDLGDHQPLNQWLARTYDKIESKLGYRIMHWLRYDDLKVFNYGIPVVFHPRGRGGDSWDVVEYGKHFVPFSGAVTYWTVNGACQAVAPGLWAYACGTISEGPRYAVESWIAPFISKRVYRMANGGSCEQSDVLDLDSILAAGDQYAADHPRSE
jgi:hypothetical protein